MSATRSGMYSKTNMHSDNVRGQNISDSSLPVSPSGDGFTPHLLRTPVSAVSPLVRSQSIPCLKYVNEDIQGGTKFSFVQSSGLGERTPVTEFCTPCQNGSGRFTSDDHSETKLMSQKQLSDQHCRIPFKRFSSEVNIHKVSATPDCFRKVHMETRRNKCEPEDLPVLLGEETSNIIVGVRVRPLIMREQDDASVVTVVSVNGNEIKVMRESGMAYTFTYDYCFWSCDPQHSRFASQDVVFTTMVQPLIDKVFLGYSACLFAYGQTGSGKSYSMMGINIDGGDSIGKEAGIIPRFCHELFERIASLDNSDVGTGKSTSSNAKVEISYFEIYNEKIHDLLGQSCDGGKHTPLKVREHPVFGPYVVDLSAHGVTSYTDLQGWLTIGNGRRATAATGMNENSSRSHSIFSIILTQTQEEAMEGRDYHKHCRHSKINLVDLAGSERLSHTGIGGDRLRESVSINRSLLTLGKVITAISDNGSGKKKSFVPYRDSVLTWLLRESLGGNSQTMMLATISPANIHVEETLSTLRYACQAGTIVNQVCINENPQTRLIRELQAEIEHLRAERQMKMGVPCRLLQSDKIGINDSDHKIEGLKKQVIRSEELARDETTIEIKDSKLTLILGCDGEIFVNGEVTKERLDLRHGDHVVIGGNHCFRVSNPNESSTTATGQLADYEGAHQKILRIQEEKLHTELYVARQAIQELEEAKKEAEQEIGLQQMNYEQQLKQMSITLEEQRYALADIQSKKDELERQKAMLEAEIQKRNRVQETAVDFIVTPYSSNFLQEVEAALNETVLETENILEQGTRSCNSSGCVGLHELIVAVQEANQYCKELYISFTDDLKELIDVDLSWQDDYCNGNSGGDVAQSSSRVSVGTHQLQQELNDSIQHLSQQLSSCSESALESSGNSLSVSDNTNTTDGTHYSRSISNCLQQVKTLANRLHILCKKMRRREKVNEILDSLHGSIQQPKSILDTSHDHEASFTHQCDSSGNSPKISGNSPQKSYFLKPPSHDLPRRSNLRSPCSTPSSRTQKAVRFFLTTSQQD